MKNRLQAFRWWDSVHSESTPHSAAERVPTHIAELKTSFIINIQAIYSGYIQDAKTAVKTAEDSPGCKYILFSEGYFWGFFQSTLLALGRLDYSWVGFHLLWNNTCNLFDFSLNLMIKYVRLDKSISNLQYLCVTVRNCNAEKHRAVSQMYCTTYIQELQALLIVLYLLHNFSNGETFLKNFFSVIFLIIL